MDNFETLIFSKDRPLQLDLTLRTYEKHCKSNLYVKGYVLYEASNEKFEAQYRELEERYEDFVFWREMDFKTDVCIILKDEDYVFFVVDDTVFLRDFSLEEIVKTLDLYRGIIGFSLRLGKNTTHCYPLNIENDIPEFKSIVQKEVYGFDWTQAGAGDFSYPLELSSSVYRVSDIWHILDKTIYENPNSLEWVLSRNAVTFAKNMRFLACSNKSLAVSLPLNRVQTVNNNRVGKDEKYSVENLSKIFSEGMVVDPTIFENFTSNGCHQEIDLKFMKKDW